MSANPETTSHHVEVDGTKIHYLSSGDGAPVLMLHGWPTSAHLYRDILPIFGGNRRAIALDLPGYGWSDKPPNTRYSFTYYGDVLDGFLNALDIEKTDLVVHDLGGPVGVWWALRNPDKINRLVLLNTLLYPELSWAVKLFGLSVRVPLIRDWMASPAGLRFSMRLGVHNKTNITDEVMRGYEEPLTTKEAKTGLLKGAQGLSMKGFHEIAENLSTFEGPVRIIYGEHDRILPDVAETMRRVKVQLPKAEITALSNCGHFLQEDDAKEVGELIESFLSATD
jgi:haloalkane dehalogenase